MAEMNSNSILARILLSRQRRIAVTLTEGSFPLQREEARHVLNCGPTKSYPGSHVGSCYGSKYVIDVANTQTM